jgi:hypothetical protein
LPNQGFKELKGHLSIEKVKKLYERWEELERMKEELT